MANQAYRAEFRFLPGGWAGKECAGGFGFDGYGDVSDGSHGPALQRPQDFALLVVCAKGG